MYFLDLSTIPQQLVRNLNLLGFSVTISNWLLGFLTNRPHLFSMTSSGMGTGHQTQQLSYRQVVNDGRNDKNLILKIKKIKQMIINFRHSPEVFHPSLADSRAVEVVSSLFLGVQITDCLYGSVNTSSLVKWAQQHLYFLHTFSSDPHHSLLWQHRDDLLNICLVWKFQSSEISLQRVVRT